MRAAYPFENISAKPVLCLGSSSSSSMSLHPPSTSHNAKPTTAATVAPKYHAAETMPIDIARWCLGANSVMSEVAMG